MKNLKSLHTYINEKTFASLLTACSRGDIKSLGTTYGTIQDNYVFLNPEFKDGVGIVFGSKHLPRKYIIISERYLEDGSSVLKATETCSNKDAYKFINLQNEAQN